MSCSPQMMWAGQLGEAVGDLDGVATDYAWFVGEPSTSYLIIRGEFESLMPFVASPEYQAIALKAGMVNTDFSSGWFFTGEAVDGVMGMYGELASQLA